jgi:hypothetical protein
MAEGDNLVYHMALSHGITKLSFLCISMCNITLGKIQRHVFVNYLTE